MPNPFFWNPNTGKLVLRNGGTIDFGSAVKFSGASTPSSSDGAALGSASLMWSDLFLASGSVINFDNGDVTITHSANALAVAGGTSYSFDADVKPDANDSAQLGVSGTAWSDLFLASGAVINFNAGNMTVTHSAGDLTVAGGPVSIKGASAGAATAALLHGCGTTATPGTTATANKNFIGYWVESTATSGDCRGEYVRLYISGVGGSGEAGRFYTTVNNVTAATGGTVNGAHISLNVTGASGAISGSANALRCTLDFAGTPTAIGGTVACLRLDSNFAAGPTIPTGTAFIAINDLGSQNMPYFMSFETVGSALFTTATNTVIDHALKIRVNGTDYWIGLYDATAP